MKTHRFLVGCLALGLAVGCSSVTVVKNPGEGDRGIRYYRPKPYLLVTPADATGRMVNIKLQYLPDYSEEYSIRPRGKKPPAVALEDGWNLVGVGGPPAPPKPQEPVAIPAAPTDPTKLPEFVVAATNVPIGYYESVFDKNKDGGKTLKGWRYVGLTPNGGGGPAVGVEPKPVLPPGCPPPPPGSAMSGPLYGMVFFNGVMTFRQLDEIAANQTCPQYVKILPDKPEPAPTRSGGAKLDESPDHSGGEKLPESGGGKLDDADRLDPLTPDEAAPGDLAPPPPPTPDGTALNLDPAPSLLDDAAVAKTSIAIPPPKVWDAPR